MAIHTNLELFVLVQANQNVAFPKIYVKQIPDRKKPKKNFEEFRNILNAFCPINTTGVTKVSKFIAEPLEACTYQNHDNCIMSSQFSSPFQ